MKTKKYVLAVFVASLFIVCGRSSSVYASSKAECIPLETYTTYKQYDVTGDGKKDKLYICPYKDESNDDNYIGVGVYVNGQRVYQKTGYDEIYSINANLYRLKNDITYLEILADGPSDWLEIGELLQYKSGKYGCILNYSGNITRGGSIEKIESSKITIRYWSCFHTIGTASFKYTYTKKNGKWVESKYGNYPQIFIRDSSKTQTSLVARRNFYVYKAVNSKTKAFKIKKGAKVKIKKLRIYKKSCYIQVEYNGKTGWLIDDASVYWSNSGFDDGPENNPLFNNLVYGG